MDDKFDVEDYLDLVLETAKEIALESKAVHPHDIMCSVLTTIEVLYKQSEKMPYNFLKLDTPS